MRELHVIHGTRHVAWQCGTCGVWATCPEIVYEQHYAQGGYHFCPNGHQWGWSKEKCEREQLRRERDMLKQQAARLEDEARLASERAEKAEAANRRIKKRSAAGTCPCCQRTFSNMAEHMKRQHPQFVADSGATVIPIKRGTRASP
jgi:hypothetical protein